MAPVASKIASKLKDWILIDDAFTSDGKIVLCTVCDKRIGCSMKSQLEQHLKTDLQVRKKQRAPSKKQVLLTQVLTPSSPSTSEFNRDLCMAMIAANIPWYKLGVPKFNGFLRKYCNFNIPDESTLRKNYLDSCYINTMESIKAELCGGYIWIAVDETTDALGRFIANLIAGKLDPDASSKPYLIYCKQLEQTNHATVSRFVNNGLKELGVNEEKVLVLYSDAASYMLKAAGALSVFYPNMVHLTCLAHGLHRVAETIRDKFPKVNGLISETKKVFRKSPYRMQCYKKLLPDVPFPPQPVTTRWGTWIEAVTFYNEHFDAVKSVLETFSPESAASVRESINAFHSNVASSIVYITSHFSWIPNSIKKLETSGLALHESMSIVEEATKKLSTAPGVVGESVSKKLDDVLKKNPAYSTFINVCKVFVITRIIMLNDTVKLTRAHKKNQKKTKKGIQGDGMSSVYYETEK